MSQIVSALFVCVAIPMLCAALTFQMVVREVKTGAFHVT